MPFQLQKIALFQFKNYVQNQFSFNERLVGICGRNGSGKTNLLDSIYYLCFTKSYFTKTDSVNVLWGGQGFRIAASFTPPPTILSSKRLIEVTAILRETGRKEFSIDGIMYEKLIQHIGKFSCVFIAPDDVQLITGASEERRRFIDALLCQLDTVYLQHLMDYNKVLQQRNSYLKNWAEQGKSDTQLLDIYDQQLLKHGQYVFEKRKVFIKELILLAQQQYFQIAAIEEPISITYESALLQHDFAKLLQMFREKDKILQRTTQGIHRDDLQINFDGQSFKSIASQGQRKSLLFALKLAEFELLKKHKEFAPILLLDDVFEKLDAGRMQNLILQVCVSNKGQVFITDTHKERMEAAFKKTALDYQMVEL